MGIAKLGSKIYFLFMVINLACVPVIYLFYPETKGRALEDMDALFGGSSGNSTDNLLEHLLAEGDNYDQLDE